MQLKAKLVDTASQLLAQLGDGSRHTVAAAALTKSNKIVAALNISHFTGGPCAEISLLAKLVSENEEPTTMVSIGDSNRGILAPCGRCRQVLLDYYPSLKVIMPGGGVKSMQELLPDAYEWFKQPVITVSE